MLYLKALELLRLLQTSDVNVVSRNIRKEVLRKMLTGLTLILPTN